MTWGSDTATWASDTESWITAATVPPPTFEPLDLSEAITRSHTAAFLAEVLRDGAPVEVLPITGGDVRQSFASRIRSSCDVTVVGSEWVPRTNSDLLAPYGTEVRLWRGVAHPNGEQALVPLGVFGLSDVDVADGGGIKVLGYDRGRRVSMNRWIDPYVIAQGTNVGAAIQALILDRYPSATFNFASTSHVTPTVVLGEETDNDPWEDAQKLARASGLDLYLDGFGRFTLEPIRDPDTSNVSVQYHEGAEATFESASKRITDEYLYNVVVASGESSNGPPVRAVAEDANPTSATYVGGPFGRRPYRLTSELITTQAQAQAAADGQLAKVLGATEVVSLSCIPDPSRRVGEVIEVRRESAGVDARYVIDELNIPMTVDGSMGITTRRRRL